MYTIYIGTNLSKYHTEDTIFAGFHYDISFLIIHGRSKYPGLYIWLRSGRKVPVRVPEGCLFVQVYEYMNICSFRICLTSVIVYVIVYHMALSRILQSHTYTLCVYIQVGKQLEWLTGGRFVAGYHEVVCSADTIRAYEQASAIRHDTTTYNTNNDTNNTNSSSNSSSSCDDIWRVSCTLFSQVNTDYILQPLLQESQNYDPLDEPINRYPSVLAGEMIKNELKVISLHSSEDEEAVTS